MSSSTTARSRARSEVSIDFGGQRWRLLPGRAAMWEERRWLILADVHFGKAAAFRARGVPVPEGTTQETLQRLDDLLAHEHPEVVVFLGDLFHARESHAPTTLGTLLAWRERHAALPLLLVEGNHDLAAGAPPPGLRIEVEAEPWCVDGIAFCHHPQRVRGASAWAGHLHPAVRLTGRADDGVRLPCFWMRPELGVLPAFGSFTGAARIDREDGDRVIAIADDRLYEIPAFA
jgi:DNA ligase-associated metallophosphoesterase